MRDYDATVINEFGKIIYYEAAVNLMDDEIMAEMEGLHATGQAYFDDYCSRHEERYGEPFECSKLSPQY